MSDEMTVAGTIKVNIPRDVFEEIGKIAVLFSFIEHSLAEMITSAGTLGQRRREIGSIITAEMSFRQRLAALSSILRFAIDDDHGARREFDELQKQLTRAEEQRNVVIHSVWARPDPILNPAAVVRMKTTAKASSGLKHQHEVLTLEELKAITSVVSSAYERLVMFEWRFFQTQESAGPQE